MDENINIREMIISPLEYEKFIREKKRTNAAKEYFASIAEEYSQLPKEERDYLDQFSVTRIVYNEAGIIIHYEISFKDKKIFTVPFLYPEDLKDFFRRYRIDSYPYDKLSQRLILSLNETEHIKRKSIFGSQDKMSAWEYSTTEIAMEVISYIYNNILIGQYDYYDKDRAKLIYNERTNYHYIRYWYLSFGRPNKSLFHCRRDILWRVLKYLFTNDSVIIAFHKLRGENIISGELCYKGYYAPQGPMYEFSLTCDDSSSFFFNHISSLVENINFNVDWDWSFLR